MRFSDYLKTCRERFSLTQEALVTELYLFDDEAFEGITPTTVSRWERGVTSPPPKRMAEILAFFQKRSGEPLPCLGDKDPEEVETLICDTAIETLFRPKKMVADTPLTREEADRFALINLRHHPRADELLELNAMLHRHVNTPFTRVDAASFKKWIEYPGNLFSAVTYRTSFLGLLFSLRLKPAPFDDILSFRHRKADLGRGDFAAPNEEGSVYMLSFFALSQEIATLLFRRFYAHLIANQSSTREVGYVTSFEEALELARRMHLARTGIREGGETPVVAYRSDLFGLMRSPMALKIIFPKEPCG